ncbi:MAG TPA: GreA/GreB family elongation factor [Candidatus Dojkabacteria bacterium]|nr:GreA/GreB family elongation factor [Candidatus Dojkabacteria bacterium]HOT60844.1 GreA/GreB family elongation factor [Candidatus Dojkabacteria bacterium]HQI92640.1 GreA/GreB family elongation factor [Candidatus Dojkabacteria bacterium]
MEEGYKTTKEGLLKLKEELKYRETELKKKITDNLNEMRNQGDLSENDGYSMAVEEFHINEEKILEIKEKLKNAIVIKDTNKKRVSIGDTVTLKGDTTLKYTLASEDEANPFEGKISYLSPIGIAIMDKKIKSSVSIQTPKGIKKYTIENIS